MPYYLTFRQCFKMVDLFLVRPLKNNISASWTLEYGHPLMIISCSFLITGSSLLMFYFYTSLVIRFKLDWLFILSSNGRSPPRVVLSSCFLSLNIVVQATEYQIQISWADDLFSSFPPLLSPISERLFVEEVFFV